MFLYVFRHFQTRVTQLSVIRFQLGDFFNCRPNITFAGKVPVAAFSLFRRQNNIIHTRCDEKFPVAPSVIPTCPTGTNSPQLLKFLISPLVGELWEDTPALFRAQQSRDRRHARNLIIGYCSPGEFKSRKSLIPASSSSLHNGACLTLYSATSGSYDTHTSLSCVLSRKLSRSLRDYCSCRKVCSMSSRHIVRE